MSWMWRREGRIKEAGKTSYFWHGDATGQGGRRLEVEQEKQGAAQTAPERVKNILLRAGASSWFPFSDRAAHHTGMSKKREGGSRDWLWRMEPHVKCRHPCERGCVRPMVVSHLGLIEVPPSPCTSGIMVRHGKNAWGFRQGRLTIIG